MKKKLYSLSVLVLLTVSAFAQFFDSTSYRGAFPKEGGYNWTEGWTNWDPDTVEYPNTTVTVDADITTNTTWRASDVIYLKNKVYVTGNVTLTIEAGAVIRGDKATQGTLIISKGSKIMAEGTAVKPIVFTSAKSVSDGRAAGDWGGLIVLGNGINNQGSSVIEGGLDATKAAYGGSDNAENSGVLKFIRIEYAGVAFQPDKEINSLTLGGVGSGTTVDFIQCSFGGDDSFEWFGGAVNCKHLISYRTTDDDFDTDFGYSGNVQYGLIVRDPKLSDQCTCSTSEGFESDNDGSGSSKNPLTKAIFSNITSVGPLRGNVSATLTNDKFERGVRIRKNSALSLYNSIIVDWEKGLYLDGSASIDNFTGDTAAVKGILLAGNGADTSNSSSTSFTWANYSANKNINIYDATADVKFVNPHPDFEGTGDLTPDYRLKDGSPALSGVIWDTRLGSLNNTNSVKETNSISSMILSPNPSNGLCKLSLALNKSERVTVNIIDITGKTVKNIISENMLNIGNNEISIQTNDLNSGLYLVNINTSNGNKTIRLSVIK